MIVTFKSSFLKTIAKIRNAKIKDEIANAIENVEGAANLLEIKSLKKLKGHKEYYRIKIDSFRFGLKIVNHEVFFVDVDHRKDIYKRFP